MGLGEMRQGYVYRVVSCHAETSIAGTFLEPTALLLEEPAGFLIASQAFWSSSPALGRAVWLISKVFFKNSPASGDISDGI